VSGTEAKIQKVKKVIDRSVEPKIAKVIEEFNKSIAKMGMRVGAEIQWFIEEIPSEPRRDG
jgi:hypothetical protein